MYDYDLDVFNNDTSKLNYIRFLLINYCCFCTCYTGITKKKCIPISEISASEYIYLKKKGLSDLRIYEKTGFHY